MVDNYANHTITNFVKIKNKKIPHNNNATKQTNRICLKNPLLEQTK